MARCKPLDKYTRKELIACIIKGMEEVLALETKLEAKERAERTAGDYILEIDHAKTILRLDELERARISAVLRESRAFAAA